MWLNFNFVFVNDILFPQVPARWKQNTDIIKYESDEAHITLMSLLHAAYD